MSDRVAFIHDANRPDTSLIAACVRKVADTLDRADNKEHTDIHPLLDDNHTALDWAHAWMATAVLIGDATEAATPELLEASYVLDRASTQPHLF